jgi:hypothetical protein
MEGGSSRLSHPIAISAQGNSPYDLAEIIRIAKKRIILIAQNHRFMTNPAGAADAFRDQLFAKIKRGLSIEIVAMHPDARPPGADDLDACKVWGLRQVLSIPILTLILENAGAR